MIDRFFLGDFEETSAGLFRNAFQHLLPVRTRLFRIALPPTPSAARISDAGSAESTAVAIGIVALEKDGINDCVCPLGRLNRGVESFFAPSVDSIGKKHKSFATLLFLHEFIRGE